MKGIDIFCASQSATAICLSMELKQASSSSSSYPYSTPAATAATILLAGGGGSSSPAIDRHNPIITDSSRKSTSIQIPPPHQNLHQKKKTKKVIKINKKIPLKENGDQISKKKNIDINDINDDEKIKISSSIITTSAIGRKSWRCTKPGDFISPPGSTRYLLSDQKLLDFDQPPKSETSKGKPPPSSAPPEDQVVVLRVSLHCRGCEKKMRKHISRMEGVTSFNIDFAAKKVTVAGKVTPVEVLSSISKVKNAQLWPPTISSSTPPPPPPPPPLPLNLSNSLEFKNEYKKGASVTDKVV